MFPNTSGSTIREAIGHPFSYRDTLSIKCLSQSKKYLDPFKPCRTQLLQWEGVVKQRLMIQETQRRLKVMDSIMNKESILA